MRVELQKGELPVATRQRIALAVAEHRGYDYSVAQYAKTAKAAGLGLDEVSKARSFGSDDPKEEALLIYLKAALEAEGAPPIYLHEEARERRAGPTRRSSKPSHMWPLVSSRV